MRAINVNDDQNKFAEGVEEPKNLKNTNNTRFIEDMA